MVLQRKILNKNFFPGKSFNTFCLKLYFTYMLQVIFLSQVIFIFAFVSTLLGYITIPKNKQKKLPEVKKINYNKYKLQVY